MQTTKTILTALLAISAHAGTLLQTGPGGQSIFVSAPVGLKSAYASGFSLDQAYTNLSIEAMLGSTATYPAGNVFLMRQIGVNATSAHELDSRALNFPVTPGLNNGSFQTMFSGLTLDAGSYYLVVETPVGTSTDPVGWFTGTALNTASGIGFLGNFVRLNPPAYAPSSNFSSFSNTNLIVRVSGDPAVPEPATLALTAAALLAIGLYKRRS